MSSVTIHTTKCTHGLILRPALAVLLCGLLLSPRPDASGTVFFPAVPKKCLHNATVSTGPNGETIYSVKDLTYRKSSDPLFTDIALSFNAPSSRLRRDDTRHYRITGADYEFMKGAGALGKGCARFFKKDHGVTIQTVKGAWLGSCEDLGSFNIEFRLKPYEVRDGSVLFSRIGYFSGAKRGIEITIADGTIRAALYGIFDKPSVARYDVTLLRGKKLTTAKWHHYSLSYDRISGKLTSYLNGEESEVMYLTESGEAFNGVYAPSFGYRDAGGRLRCIDTPPAAIGVNYSGLIDEFRISYRHFEDLERRTALAYRNYHSVGTIGRIPFNVEGVITSPVYRFAETGTKVQDFRWKEGNEKDTFVWMEFRTSDINFNENDASLKWYRIGNEQKKIFLVKNGAGEYLRGKYYQWRAHLVVSPDGKRSPRLQGIEIDYRLDLSPGTPRFLEVAAAGDRNVILKWRKNSDHDILGYKIYYGTRPGIYDGIITAVDGTRISNGTGPDIQVKITNDVIEENRALDRAEKLTFPFLQNTVLYYFAVSAYDSYKPDTRFNHESDLSKPVSARPFQGTEIK